MVPVRAMRFFAYACAYKACASHDAPAQILERLLLSSTLAKAYKGTSGNAQETPL